MCLAIPGRIASIEGGVGADPLLRTARVDFGGIAKDVSLAILPDARMGEYVLVHAGFAISRIDEAEARRVFEYLDEIGELEAERGSTP